MDRYVILAVSVVLLICMFSFFNIEEDESIIGYADNISETDSGFVFSIISEDGNETKSYFSEKPDTCLHRFYGNYSEDGSVFFIDNISEL